MIYKYEELEEYIREDFYMYYKKMNFNDKQICCAIFDDYKRGEDETGLKNICIHIFLILNYKNNGFNYTEILQELQKKMENMSFEDIKSELKDEYDDFMSDYNRISE